MDLAKITEQLTEQIKVLEEKLARIAFDDPAKNQLREIDNEAEDDTQESESGFRVQSLEQELKTQINHAKRALTKIGEKTYGTCDRCGKPIEANRLLYLPTAVYCLSCQGEIDHLADLQAGN